MASQTLPTIYQPVLRIPTASRRDSLTLPTTILSRSPITSNEASPDMPIPSRQPRLSRASLDEIVAHFPITGPIQLRATSLSAINRNNSNNRITRPPRVHLPGAVIENEEEEDEYYNDESVNPQRPTTSHIPLDSPLRQSASF
uniref:Uncharacterized protein n=1 Tax=Panagrolaimus sp. PS1159 TaxID=55785 RepID=A0AC35F7V8_9BILA